MYAGIMNVLGSEDGQFIECSVTKTIDFQVGGVTVSLPPSVYLDRDWEDEYGKLKFEKLRVGNFWDKT